MNNRERTSFQPKLKMQAELPQDSEVLIIHVHRGGKHKEIRIKKPRITIPSLRVAPKDQIE